MELKDPENGTLPVPALQALAKNNVFASFVSKEFGGNGFCQKDKLLIMEKLGSDLSIFSTVNQVQTAASLITSCGTMEQKTSYLPKIASFQIKPVICLRDDT